MEKFIINGVTFDQTKGKSAQMVFQTPLFEDINNIVSNRTNSVDFPLTPNNLRAIGYSHIVQAEGDFIYRKHEAAYYRDDTLVFVGVGYVLGITPTAIKMTFVWGNVSAFQDLMDKSLQELQDGDNPDHYTLWGSYADRDPEYNWRTDTYIGEVDNSRQLPMLKVDTILDEIASKRGITINKGNLFSDLAIPLLTKYKDAQSNAQNALHITTGSVAPIKVSNDDYRFVLIPTYQDSDPSRQYIGDGIYDVENADELVVKISAGFTISADMYSLFADSMGVSVFACDSDGLNAVNISGLNGKWKKSYNETSAVLQLVEDVEFRVNVKQYTFIYFQLARMKKYTPFPMISGVDFTAINSGNQVDGEIEWNNIFPLYRNLPDISQGQFIKNLLWLRGLFAYASDNKTIDFVRVDDLYNNLADAWNISDKIILNKGLSDELSPTYGTFARINFMKWKESDEITDNFNGEMYVDNDTLDKEKTLVTMDFAPIQNGVIPVWSTDDGGQTWEFNSGLAPRIFRFGQPIDEQGFPSAYFTDEFAFSTIIDRYFGSYQRTILRPKKIKLSMRCDIKDLLNIDMLRPIYIKQLGSYFALLKLTTKDEKVADLELLKLNLN